MADGEVQSRLARIWSPERINDEYFSSSPEILPTKSRDKGDVLKSVQKLGVPLFGLTERGGVPPSLSFAPRAVPEVETTLLDSEDDELEDVEAIREGWFSNHILGRELIKEESKKNALRRRERQEARDEDESEIESETDVMERVLPRTDSHRYSATPPVAAKKAQKRKERKKRKWFSRRKRSAKAKMVESVGESEVVPIMRTDTRVFNFKKETHDSEDEMERDAEDLMLSAPKVGSLVEEEAGLDTEAEDSEKVDSEEELESEAESFELNKRESGAEKMAAFLAAESKKKELLSLQSESEDEEEEEDGENALQRFLRLNESEGEVEELVESEEEGPNRYQQFLAMSPPHEDEITELKQREDERKAEPVSAEPKSKRVSRERKELEERKAVTSITKPRVSKSKRASKSRKETTKRRSKRRSAKRGTAKPVPKGYYEKSVVKPTNVEVTESPVLTVQAWFSALVALLITFFTFMKGKALGLAVVDSSKDGQTSSRQRHSRTHSSASRRRSLKQENS